ncbi:MAG: NAD-dependent epimerase/dehydratase family protein, partial [Thermoplasmata archaeon]|nr:NAD-dependent epimerase/dehydratase family protein [Thermoplasmata archaeon]
EAAPLSPVNVYGHSKVAGELLVGDRRAEHRACVVRFSNVFGSANDHADRVVPAFVRAALAGTDLRVDGSGHLFDFTFVEDVVLGLHRLVELMEAGEPAPPPIHYVSGTGVTLGELASEVVEVLGSKSRVREAPPRSYDVARFVGDPTRAKQLLGWKHETSLRDGILRLGALLRAA